MGSSVSNLFKLDDKVYCYHDGSLDAVSLVRGQLLRRGLTFEHMEIARMSKRMSSGNYVFSFQESDTLKLEGYDSITLVLGLVGVFTASSIQKDGFSDAIDAERGVTVNCSEAGVYDVSIEYCLFGEAYRRSFKIKLDKPEPIYVLDVAYLGYDDETYHNLLTRLGAEASKTGGEVSELTFTYQGKDSSFFYVDAGDLQVHVDVTKVSEV